MSFLKLLNMFYICDDLHLHGMYKINLQDPSRYLCHAGFIKAVNVSHAPVTESILHCTCDEQSTSDSLEYLP